MRLERPVLRRFLYVVALICAAGPLSSCQYFMPNPPSKTTKYRPAKHNSQASPALYATDSYVQQLTQARITLADPAASPADAEVDIIDGYANQKAGKAAVQRLIVLEYGPSDKADSKYLIPYQDPAFSGLAAVMERLPSSQLTNIELRAANITPSMAPQLRETENVRASLESANKRLLQNAHRLPALEEVRSQMALAHFFIAHRFRDAAYLTVDNAKKQLAAVSRKEDSEALKALGKEMEGIEIQLHKELPYTLSQLPRGRGYRAAPTLF